MNESTLKTMFSSKTDLWSTPQDLFDKLDKIYNFQWDVCASHDNRKVEGRYYTEQEDGLKQHWCNDANVFWMNPPYGRELGKWVAKAYEESTRGCTVVCLLPARTDTKWFHEYCLKGSVEFIKGRLKFNGHKNAAPFPSMIVVFKP